MKLIAFLFLILFPLLGFGQGEDDKLLEGLHKDRKQQTEAVVAIDQVSQNIQEKVFNAPEELRKLGYETLTAASMMDDKVVRIVKQMMANNALHRAEPRQVRKLIFQSTEGKFFHEYLKESPKLMNALVEVLRDPKALSALIGILLKKEVLNKYLIIWLGLIVMSWLIRRYLFNKKWSWFRRFSMGMLLSVITMSASLAIFYKLFYEELSPTTQILVKHIKI